MRKGLSRKPPRIVSHRRRKELCSITLSGWRHCMRVLDSEPAQRLRLLIRGTDNASFQFAGLTSETTEYIVRSENA